MKTIHFHIHYPTHFGEELYIHTRAPQSDGTLKERKFKMECRQDGLWTCTIQVPEKQQALDYFFSMGDGHDTKRHEWTTICHRLVTDNPERKMLNVYCRWQEMPQDSYRYSVAFTDTLNHQHPRPLPKSTMGRAVRLVVRAPQLVEGQRLAVIGDNETLGAWDPHRAVPMTQQNYNEWAVDLDAKTLSGETIELKFAICRDDDPGFFLWEEGLNRTVSVVDVHQGEMVVYELDQAFFALPDQRMAGTLIPVFSLRSEGSFGVGDFGDLRLMADWVSRSGQRVLQILPVNDTTSTHSYSDSYPYSCISIFALHPLYADLRQLPPLRDKARRRHYETLRQTLNALPQVDYEQVIRAKEAYLREIFAQEGETMMRSNDYKTFWNESQSWLVPYAQYCHLRDTLGTTDFTQWTGHSRWNESDREQLSTPGTEAYAEVAYYYFVQFVLSRQLADAHAHARRQSVVLKGDIPIGVCRNGCDVWMEPDYFNMNGQAGAPPDDFSANGQNWGFPTYNWPAMLADGCRWWVRRFRNMARYFDAYRIDHVLGFFRIWEIPIECVHGLLGQFSPSLGLTAEEIEGYGLTFNEEHLTRPFISQWVVERLFGPLAMQVTERFLQPLHDDILQLKPEFDTERKIEAYFHALPEEPNKKLKQGLMTLVTNVLFVKDHKQQGLYHPRITAWQTTVYEALWDKDKQAFDRLYHDYYYQRNNNFWYNEAMKKLPRLVEATRMLVCAEDLGMVPECVAWVMNELRILSLEIQSMPKAPHVPFGLLDRNPYRSVCTLFTHDMPTLRQWWDEDETRTQHYYNASMRRDGTAPHPLPAWLARDIIQNQLASPSMLCVLSLQDWMAIDECLRLPDANAERINIPADPHHYWRYRMHTTIEHLIANHAFTLQVRELCNKRQ
ncbi:MAG: 4-alpha-glucanotransferase [Bacteroidaceae bacterium]|nr:4-alpha-glucanotransferase [Bacteroidaceae bacterium]